MGNAAKAPPNAEFSGTDMVTNWHQIESPMVPASGRVGPLDHARWLGARHMPSITLRCLRTYCCMGHIRSILSRRGVPGTELALSWSAGTDSTAAMQLLPTNTILGYHRRTVEGLLAIGMQTEPSLLCRTAAIVW